MKFIIETKEFAKLQTVGRISNLANEHLINKLKKCDLKKIENNAEIDCFINENQYMELHYANLLRRGVENKYAFYDSPTAYYFNKKLYH